MWVMFARGPITFHFFTVSLNSSMESETEDTVNNIITDVIQLESVLFECGKKLIFIRLLAMS